MSHCPLVFSLIPEPKKEIYETEGRNLEEVDEEKDLGVIMQSDLKWNRQCSKDVKSASRVLGMIRRSFSYLSQDIALQLNKTLQHLEYCVQTWRPHLKKRQTVNGRGLNESYTKLVTSMINYSYEERLKFYNLATSETKRIR
jgi:hypothetical protein